MVQIPGCSRCFDYICENGLNITSPQIFLSVADAVHEATTRYLGWDMYWHRTDARRNTTWRLSREWTSVPSAFASRSSTASAGPLGFGVSEYPLHREKDDPDFATQSHDEQMNALVLAMRKASKEAGISGDQVVAIALDTTGSSVIPVGKDFVPLDDYYLWCDHRANEAAEITRSPVTRTCRDSIGAAACTPRSGDSRSCCTGCDTILTSAASSSLRSSIATWPLQRYAASPIANQLPRSICAMGISGCGMLDLADFRPKNFLEQIDPLLDGHPRKLRGDSLPPIKLRAASAHYGRRSWVCGQGFRFPLGALTRTGMRSALARTEGDVVNVVGTATCIMASRQGDAGCREFAESCTGAFILTILGIEAGLSATGSFVRGDRRAQHNR